MRSLLIVVLAVCGALAAKQRQRTPLALSQAHAYTVSESHQGDLRIHLHDHRDTPHALGPSPAFNTLYAVPTRIARPRDNQAYQYARRQSLFHGQSVKLDWDEIDVLGPDVTDRGTLQELARMTGNAYALPGDKHWYEIPEKWNTSIPVGWDASDNGFRGHIFVDPLNTTVVLSIKGTSPPFDGPTTKNDKRNDNLLFSCCCARVDFKWSWSTVCDCYSNKYQCDNTCLEDSLREDNLFYNFGINLYNNITYLYPDANIWLIGHSLGGSLASLLGATFGAPTVAFEAPGEQLASKRLHLPSPPPTSLTPPNYPPHAMHPITHVFHTADPLPYGSCNGPLSISVCARAGYAMETKCHLGTVIEYDTVKLLGWKPDVRKHPIKQVIENVLPLEGPFDDEDGQDGQGGVEEELEVPPAKPEIDCVDCYKWTFDDFKTKNQNQLVVQIPQ